MERRKRNLKDNTGSYNIGEGFLEMFFGKINKVDKGVVFCFCYALTENARVYKGLRLMKIYC